MNVSLEILATALRLGVTSFGGPIAHLGYFREEYVERRRWLDDKTYADIVALCQFLPGPASSQVGISIGLLRGGLAGGIAAWLGFTLPSALALVLFASLLQGIDVTGTGWLRGLLIAAVAVVAQAVWGMANRLTPDRERATIAIVSAILAALVPAVEVQILIIMAAGFVGWLFLRDTSPHEAAPVSFPVSQQAAAAALVAFFGLLLVLPILRQLYPVQWLAVADSFYRAGSLVFGGGHVVLPLLQAEVVPPGWVTAAEFLAGYGAAQAVPGPLFTFSAYLGTVLGGWSMGILALMAVFLPSFLLVVGALPFWDSIRRQASFRAALSGINAAVVGILLAALYDPIWTKAIHSTADFSLALAAFGLLMLWKAPAWLVVAFSAAGGAVIGALL